MTTRKMLSFIKYSNKVFFIKNVTSSENLCTAIKMIMRLFTFPIPMQSQKLMNDKMKKFRSKNPHLIKLCNNGMGSFHLLIF